jgi:citronellol/citronellal dehydrogenase
LITGASRGIGLATALRFAKQGASVALLARSRDAPSHPRLRGTLRSAAAAVEAAGGRPIVRGVDVRDRTALRDAVASATEEMGGLDVLVNNASALALGDADREADLVHEVNARATMVALEATRAALTSSKGAVVTVSPPVRIGRLDWISDHPAYTISKYAMTMATLAAASRDVRANTVWPRRMVATDATRRLEEEMGVVGAYTKGRPPSVMAEAILRVATAREYNAAALLDEEVLPTRWWSDSSDAPLDAFVSDDAFAWR